MARNRTVLAMVLVTLMAMLWASPAGAAAPDREKVRVVTYPGHGVFVRLGQLDKLSATSAGFRKLVRAELVTLWKSVGGQPRCRTAPLVVVKRWRSDGFAMIANMGTFAPCPSGGFHAIAVREQDSWVLPMELRGQDLLYCADLRWYGVPNTIAAPTCVTEPDIDTARYRDYQVPADYYTDIFAARAAVTGDFTDRWGDLSAVRKAQRLHNRDWTLTVTGCFGPEDPVHGPALGGAPRGCEVVATRDGAERTYLARMFDDGPLDRWRLASLS